VIEKWLCRSWYGEPYKVKQVFVKETETMFIVESIQDRETHTLLGHKKRIKKSERLLYDTAAEAIQVAIKITEGKIETAERAIVEARSTLKHLETLLRPQ
jgi:hypothetical protein